MQKLLKYYKPYIPLLLLMLFFLIVQSLSDLFLPDLNADIINNGVLKSDIPYIWRTGLIMLVVTILLAISSITIGYLSARSSMAFGRDLRTALFDKVQSMSQGEMDNIGTPSLITRTTNDVQQVQQGSLMFFRMMISAPIMMVGGIIMAIRQDAPLSLSIVFILPVMLLLIFFLAKSALPLFKQVQTRTDRLNLVVREKLSGIRVIRAFVKTAYEEARFQSANADLTKISLSVHRLMALLMPTLMLIMNISSIFIYWFGAKRIDSGEMPLGNMAAFLSYIMLILFSLMMASMMFVMLPRAFASAERIRQVLDVEPSITDVDTTDTAIGDFDRLEFKNVSFKYPGAEEPVLENISFSALPGKVTAILGSTGCGKSTLIQLIPRFYDVSSGSIEINGVDIRKLRLTRLREYIGYVPQRAFLFRGSIAENLRYGKEDATETEMWEALRTSQSEDFIHAMPEGIHAPITQGGSNVSGGQRQRLAIARALVKNPSIYIFDDSFSALDYKTDSRLRHALSEKTITSAVLIVAQRVSTVLNADQIIVLEKGQIVGKGTHTDLMESCEVYREIVYSQVTKEEVG